MDACQDKYRYYVIINARLFKYQINPCPAEPRYIPFLETTDQLIRIHSFAFRSRSCQNLAIFAQQDRVKQFKFDSLCRIVVVVC